MSAEPSADDRTKWGQLRPSQRGQISPSFPTVLRPARKTEPANGLHLSSIRQRIESIFWTLKDHLGLEAHRARTLHGLRARIACKLLAYSAGVWLNWLCGRPPRQFADLTARTTVASTI
jgi:hypothetical protein